MSVFYPLLMVLIDSLALLYVKNRVQKAGPPRLEIGIFALGIVLLRVGLFQEENVFSHGLSIFISAHLVLFLVFSAALRTGEEGNLLLNGIRKPFIIYVFYLFVFTAQMMTLTN